MYFCIIINNKTKTTMKDLSFNIANKNIVLQTTHYPYLYWYDKVLIDDVRIGTVSDLIGTRIVPDRHLVNADFQHYNNNKLLIANDLYNSLGGYLPFIIAAILGVKVKLDITVHASTVYPFDTYTISCVDVGDAKKMLALAGIIASDRSTNSRDLYD